VSSSLLFISLPPKSHSCALINWFMYDNKHDPDTGMWAVQLECDQRASLLFRSLLLIPVRATLLT
jgi:hypothetical protein